MELMICPDAKECTMINFDCPHKEEHEETWQCEHTKKCPPCVDVKDLKGE